MRVERRKLKFDDAEEEKEMVLVNKDSYKLVTITPEMVGETIRIPSSDIWFTPEQFDELQKKKV